MRIDFFHQSCTITSFEDEKVETKTVDAMDIVHALTSEIPYNTGILPFNTLWWINSKRGPLWAIYEPPRTRILAVQRDATKKPTRYTVPLPGFIFLCQPAMPPWAYAVKARPTSENDLVYRAPLTNVYATGKTCAGNQEYSTNPGEIIEQFFISFFSYHADRSSRSIMFPKEIIELWKYLDKKEVFPIDDLLVHGTIHDLMNMVMSNA